MDVKICLPALYPLRYLVDHLEYRSLSTQSASLQAIKFFYEFWYMKHRATFCYSFYCSGHDPAIAIQEMTDFFQYLENITHNFIFASRQNPESPLSYNAVQLIFSEIDKIFSLNYPECKSAERFDALIKFTPHVTRHTWAYLTIKKLYNLQNKKF
ncbi:TPA: hypothetical protein ACNZ7B_005703, partial [Klebsiella quasipneumoniae subsp. similipneumoniae]